MRRTLVAMLLAIGLLLQAGTAVGQEVTARDPMVASPADNAVLRWNDTTLECIRTTLPGPTVVARTLFVVHAAMYDAWTVYDAAARRLATVTAEDRSALRVDLGSAPNASATLSSGLEEASATRQSKKATAADKRTAVSFAAYTALPEVYASCRQEALDTLESLGYSTRDLSLQALVGRLAGTAVARIRLADGSNQAGGYADTSGYEPANTPETVTDPWRWQPLRVPLGDPSGTPQVALTPHWGEVWPFSTRLSARIDAVPPPSRDPVRTIDDILAMSAGLTDRHKVIAEYWADGPRTELPPGHWNVFAQWVSRQHRQTLDDDVRLFLALNGAMLDASIAAWSLKYRTDFARPVTTIRTLMAGQTVKAWAGPYRGTRAIPAEQWRPYQPDTFPTPPFPEYVSGHSTFSAAGAEVLERFATMKGRDATAFGAAVTIPAGSSRVEPRTADHEGVPARDITLRWATFADAAREAGVSRRYGGIHWVDGDLNGRRLGRAIGNDAFRRAVGLWR